MYNYICILYGLLYYIYIYITCIYNIYLGPGFWAGPNLLYRTHVVDLCHLSLHAIRPLHTGRSCPNTKRMARVEAVVPSDLGAQTNATHIG